MIWPYVLIFQGLNEPFGTIDKPNWPYRNYNHPIWGSPAMQCEKNQYAPEGRPLHQIIDEFASDNEIWAENFLEGWQLMTSNGYSDQELIDGPENGWFGFYSLSKQGIEISNFNGYIKYHAPLKFTDPNVRQAKNITFIYFLEYIHFILLSSG